jgi:hypothetical protein
LSVKFKESDEVLLCCDSKSSRALNSAGIIPKSNPATGGTAEKRGIIKVYYEIDPHSPFFKPLCEICESAQAQNEAPKK